MVEFLSWTASLRRDMLLAGYFSQVFNMLTEGNSQLFKNCIQLSKVRGGHGLSRQIAYAIFQATARLKRSCHSTPGVTLVSLSWLKESNPVETVVKGCSSAVFRA
jgi:hypothetical protein